MRLLIVEDDPALAGIASAGLQQAGFSLDVTDSVAGADDLLQQYEYAAVLLDRGLADGDGLDLLKRLRSQDSPLPVMLMTGRGTEGDRETGLVTGADDYLVKPFDLSELVSRMRDLVRRYDASLGADLRLGNISLHTPTRALSVGGADVPLPAREALLLDVLLRAPGRVVPREALEQRLSGFDGPASPNTVETLMSRLRKRLQEAGATPVVQTIRGAGYLISRD